MATAMKGEDFYLYRNTGTWSSPTWNECDFVRDVDHKRDGDKQESHYRGSEFKRYRKGKKSVELSVQSEIRIGDADYAAFEASYDDNSAICLASANGPIATSGTKYWKYDCECMSIGEPQNDGTIVVATLEFSLADTSNEPTLITVS